jgi:hypothetical protein
MKVHKLNNSIFFCYQLDEYYFFTNNFTNVVLRDARNTVDTFSKRRNMNDSYFLFNH